MIIEVTVALSACPSTTKNLDRMSSRPKSQETREIDTSFMSCLDDCRGGTPWPPLLLCMRQTGVATECNPYNNYFFVSIPREMMCCISSALGMPSSVAGPNPNGPPSVFAANVMLSPCA